MKLIYIANARIPTEKAHGVQIAKMCEAFAKSGVGLELLIPKRANHIKEDIFSYYGLDKVFDVHRIFALDTTNIIKSKLGFIIQSAFFAASVLFYLLKNNYRGVVYSRDIFSVFLLSFFNRFELFYEIHAFPQRLNIFYRLLFPRLKFVAISHGLRDELIGCGIEEKKILVAHDGVDLDLFNSVGSDKLILRKDLCLPQDRKIVAYIGKFTMMNRSKGVELLFDAFSKVAKEIPDSFLLLVGVNREEVSKIENMIESRGISRDNYKLVEHVHHSEAIKYEKAADVLVMSYPNIKHYQLYMSPLKMFEYMAAGVPIVASDLPAIREILNEDNSVLVESDNREKLVEGIRKILQDQELAEKIAKQAFLDVKNYTWQKRAKKILEFI